MHSQDTALAVAKQHRPQLDELSVSFTTIHASNQVSKRFGVVDGKPTKLGTSPPLSSGTARRITLTTAGTTPEEIATDLLSQFGQHVEGNGPCDVTVLAPLPEGIDECQIVATDKLATSPGALARSSETFKRLPHKPAIMVLDYDVPYPAHILRQLMKVPGPNRMLRVLASVAEPFGEAAHADRASVSGRVRDRVAGKTMSGGLHQYFVVNDGSLIPGAIDRLADLLMLAGFGWYSVDRAGRLHRKVIVDVSATKNAERLVFEAPPVLEHPHLEIDPEAHRVRPSPGGFLDLSRIPDLTPAQRQKLLVVEEREKALVADEASRVRTNYIAARVEEQRKLKPAARIDERTFKRAVEHSELCGNFPLHLDSGEIIFAEDVLANPRQYHEATLADPVELDYGSGRNLAIIYADRTGARIFSHAHGGVTYRILPDPTVVFDALRDEDDPFDVFGDGSDETTLALPKHALPPALEGFVCDAADRLGVAPCYTAAAALAAASGAAIAKWHIQVKENDTAYVEPAFLAVVLVGDPASRKSPSISMMTAPLAAQDEKRAATGIKARAEYDAAQKQRGKRNNDAAVLTRPAIKRAMMENTTVEAIAGVLDDNPYGTFLKPDEMTQMTSGFGQYKNGRGNDRSLYLSLLDGRDGMRIDRASRGLTSVKVWGASLLTGTQPDVIRALSPTMANDGLMQRLLFVLDDGVRRRGADRPPDRTASEQYWSTITALAEAEPLLPKSIRLGRLARRHWVLLERRIESLLDLPGLSGAWQGHLGKWQRFAARLLLVCHLVDHVSDLGSVDRIEITEDTAKRTVRLCNWLLMHALRFYTSIVGGGEAGEDARYIAGTILTKELKAVTRHYLGQQRDVFREPDRAVRAMRFLEAHNWCVADGRRTDRHGPQDWTISPRVHDGRFSSRADSEERRRSMVKQRIAIAVRARRELIAEGTDVS